MQLFPYTLARRTALPIDLLNDHEQITLSKSVQFYQELCRHRDRLQYLIADSLFMEIKKQHQKEIKKELINLRRKVFNGRVLTAEEKAFIHSNISKANLIYWNLYTLSIDDIAKVKCQIADLFQEILQRTRSFVQRNATNEILLKGLNFSGNSFFIEEIIKYSEKDLQDFKKNDYNTEKSVIKYLTRICFKTSPFSTFTSVSFQPLKEHSAEEDDLENPTEDNMIMSSVRSNTLLFKGFLDLLFAYAPTRNKMDISLNSSIQKNTSYFEYIINVSDIESIQQLEVNPVLEFLKAELDQSTYTFKSLTDKMVECTDEDFTTCEIYLKNLIQIGFLELGIEISGLDPAWDTKLLSYLEQSELQEDIVVGKLISILQYLDASKNKMQAENYANREKILNETHSELLNFFSFYNHLVQAEHQSSNSFISSSNVFSKSDVIDFSLSRNKIFYEDTYFDNKPRPNIKYSNDILHLLNELGKYTYSLQFDIDYERLKKYYLDKYGTKETTVLDLYKNFSSEVQKQIDTYEARASDAQDNQELPPYYIFTEQETHKTNTYKWQDAFLKLINLQASQDINISKELIELAFKASDLTVTPHINGSFAVFCQLFNDKNGGYQAYAKAINSGYGRYYSRFLSASTEDVYKTLKDYNIDSLDDAFLHVENMGATFFNANIHPPLLNLELKSPNSHNTLPIINQIKFSDLIVRVDEENNPYLFHKVQNKKVLIYDLCFQNPKTRSKLYQLLNNFSPIKHINLYYIISPINKYYESLFSQDPEREAYLFLPRISYENKIILQRRSWTFKAHALPKRQLNEQDQEYYLAVKDWINFYKIPNEVFIFVNPDGYKPVAGKQAKRSADDYKPQYINFDNPILLLFFEKILHKVEDRLKIEEMLPDSEQSVNFSKSPYVYEYLFQWY